MHFSLLSTEGGHHSSAWASTEVRNQKTPGVLFQGLICHYCQLERSFSSELLEQSSLYLLWQQESLPLLNGIRDDPGPTEYGHPKCWPPILWTVWVCLWIIHISRIMIQLNLSHSTCSIPHGAVVARILPHHMEFSGFQKTRYLHRDWMGLPIWIVTPQLKK